MSSVSQRLRKRTLGKIIVPSRWHEDEKLISEVKKYRILYDQEYTSNCMEWSNRMTVWQMIADEMEMPVKICTQRWGSLRSAYSKEAKLRRIITNFKRFRHYDSMNFLSPFITPKLDVLKPVSGAAVVDETCLLTEDYTETPGIDLSSLPVCMSTPPISVDSKAETINMESVLDLSSEVNEVIVTPCLEDLGITLNQEYLYTSQDDVSHSYQWMSDVCMENNRLQQTPEEQINVPSGDLHPLEHYIRGLTKFYDRLHPESQLLFQTKTTQLLFELCQNECTFHPISNQKSTMGSIVKTERMTPP